MTFRTLLLCSLLITFSYLSKATPITTDTFIASSSLANSGDHTELAWVRDIMKDQSIKLDKKYESEGNDWTLVAGETDVYTTNLHMSPGYFLLKFGVGKTGVDSHLLFKNIGDLSTAVIDFSLAGIDLSSIKNFTIDRISHIDEFDAQIPPTTTIPEPLSSTLFGLAVIGLLRRNRQR